MSHNSPRIFQTKQSLDVHFPVFQAFNWSKKIDLEPDAVFQVKNFVNIYRGFPQTIQSLDVDFPVFQLELDVNFPFFKPSIGALAAASVLYWGVGFNNKNCDKRNKKIFATSADE